MPERDGGRRSAGKCPDRHLEDVPVIPRVSGRGSAIERLLATEPTAPGRRPTRTVPNRADETPVLPHEAALAMRFHFQRAGAACRIRVVGERPRSVMRLEPVRQNPGATRGASRRPWPQRVAGLAIFMVANEQDVPVHCREGSHAIHRLRGREAVLHRVPFVADDPVLKSDRQREIFSCGAERAIPDAGTPLRLSGGPARDERIEEAAADRGGSGGCRRPCQELASIERGTLLIHVTTSDSPARGRRTGSETEPPRPSGRRHPIT